MKSRLEVGVTRTVLTSALLLSSTAALAVPSLSNRCPVDFKLQEPPESAGYVMSEDCKVVHVLPPSKGKVRLSSVAPTASVDLCSSLQLVLKANEEHARAFAKVARFRNEVIDERWLAFRRVNDYKKELAQRQSELMAANASLESAKRKLEPIQADADSKKADLDICRGVSSSCASEESALKRALRSVADFRMKILAPLEGGVAQHSLRADQLKELLKEETDHVVSMSETLSSIDKEVASEEADMLKRYRDYGLIEGASAKLSFTVEHPQLVKKFEAMNGGKGLRFEMVRPVNSRLWSSVVADGTQGTASPIPAVLSSQVPGLSVTSSGDKEADALGATLGSGADGLVHLSLAYVCKLTDYRAVTARIPEVGARQISDLLVLRGAYEYDVQAFRSYKMSFNLEKLLERIQKSTKSGGFFKTSAVNELIFSQDYSDWLELEIDSNSSGYAFTPEEEEKIRIEVKSNLVRRVLDGVTNITLPSDKPGLPDKPGEVESGASAASKELQKCPNVYCQAAGAILGVADAMFGSRETAAKFMQSHRGRGTEVYRGYKMVRSAGTVAFDSY